MRRYADPPAAYSAINSTNTQYKGRAFRIPEMTRWVVVLSGDLVQEYVRLPETTVSLNDAILEVRTRNS